MSEANYRFELAKTQRAFCQNVRCKESGEKIAKGELRFGTLATINEHQTWRWKHWGCVTPRQIGTLISQLEGLDFDDDKDLEVIDGWDEIDEQSHEKIRQALKDGHVADEEWKGEPELNRPGQKGINKRTPKEKKAEEDAEAGDDAEPSPSKPKPKKSRAKKVKAEDEDEAGPDEPAPKKTTARKRKAATVDQDEDEDLAKTPVNPKAKSRAKKVKEEDPEIEPQEKAETAGKTKKSTKTKKIKREEPEEEPALPTEEDKPKRASRSKKVKREEPDSESPDELPPVEVKPKKSSKTTKAKKEKVVEEMQNGAAETEDSVPGQAVDMSGAGTEEEMAEKPRAKAKGGRKAGKKGKS